MELLHAGSLIVDDIEDGSTQRRGAPSLHQLYGVPVALNTGNWLYFAPMALIPRLELPPACELAVTRRVVTTLLRCHQGRRSISRCGSVIPAQGELSGVVAASTRLKTGVLMELSAVLGALAAGAGEERVEALGRFGMELGVGLQMLDDLGNLESDHEGPKQHEDSRLGRPTWPWAWLAQELPPSHFAPLAALAREVEHGRREARHLASAMRLALGRRGRERAHGLLHTALTRLAGAVGEARGLESLGRRLRGWRRVMAEQVRRAAVVGSGFGGLAVAIRLQAMGVQTVLFEARDKPGRTGLRLRGAGLHLRRGAHGHHRAALPGGALHPDRGASSPITWTSSRSIPSTGCSGTTGIAPTTTTTWRGCRPRSAAARPRRRRLSALRRVQQGRLHRGLRAAGGRAVPALLGHGEGRAQAHGLARGPLGLRRGVEVREGRAPAAGALRSTRCSWAASTDTSAIYALIHHLEKKWGVYFPRGGTGALVRALASYFVQLGGELRLSSPVRHIEAGTAPGGGPRHWVTTD